MDDVIIGLAGILLGGLCVCAGIFDWEWWYTNQRSRQLAELITRAGARWFFGLIGLGCFAFGVFSLFGMVNL